MINFNLNRLLFSFFFIAETNEKSFEMSFSVITSSFDIKFDSLIKLIVFMFDFIKLFSSFISVFFCLKKLLLLFIELSDSLNIFIIFLLFDFIVEKLF